MQHVNCLFVLLVLKQHWDLILHSVGVRVSWDFEFFLVTNFLSQAHSFGEVATIIVQINCLVVLSLGFEVTSGLQFDLL